MREHLWHWRDGHESLRGLPHLRRLHRVRWLSAGPATLPHRHDAIEIFAFEEGLCEPVIDGVARLMGPGDATLCCPWQEHGMRGDVANVGAFTLLILTFERCTRSGQLRFGPWCTLTPCEQGAIGRLLRDHDGFYHGVDGLVDAMHAIADELREQRLAWQGRINQLLSGILVLLARSLVDGGGDRRSLPTGVERAIRAVRDEPLHPWRLPELARLAGCSPGSLNAWFRRGVGLSPVHYAQHLRLELAARRLRDGTDSITDIALDLGFCSSQQFARLFRKYKGCSPRDWRGD